MKRKTCPACDGSGKVHSGYKAETTMRPLFSFNQGEKDPDTIRAVDIPRKHAIDGAFIVGLASVFAGALTGADFVQSLLIGGFAGTVAAGILRPLGTAQASKRWGLVYRLEELTGLDIDGDGDVGEPDEQGEPPPTKAPDVWVKSGIEGNQNIKHTIPFTNYKEARNFARAVLLWGVPFSRDKLVNTNAMPDHPTHYSAVYQAMIKAKLVKMVKGKNVLTSAGEQYLRKCLTPLPEGQ